VCQGRLSIEQPHPPLDLVPIRRATDAENPLVSRFGNAPPVSCAHDEKGFAMTSDDPLVYCHTGLRRKSKANRLTPLADGPKTPVLSSGHPFSKCG
jgi:hypothetical protein